VTVPDDLLALAAALAVGRLLLPATLLVCLDTEEVHTGTCKPLERFDDVRTTLKFRRLRPSLLERVALCLPLGVEELDPHVLLKLVHGNLLPADGASCRRRLVFGANWATTVHQSSPQKTRIYIQEP
jgi:hypothetical protein